ncbi:translation initiation factor IF-3-like [Babylonia areolata]|uniref:translation initiation factor IF-3-like n=1 Tax=Babylonia areolata TaxID=304850 RepID=UPI003FD4A190
MLHQGLSRLLSLQQACSIIARRQQHVPSLLPAMLRSCIFHISRITSSEGVAPHAQSLVFNRGFSASAMSRAVKKSRSKTGVSAGSETCQVFDQAEMLVGQMTLNEAEALARKDHLRLVDMGANTDGLRSLRLMSGQELAEESKRQRMEKKKERMKEKEFRVTSNITDHDLDVKLRQVKEVLSRGAQVKFVIRAHRRVEQGVGDRLISQLLKKVTQELEEQAVVKQGVRTQGEQQLLLCPLPSAQPTPDE